MGPALVDDNRAVFKRARRSGKSSISKLPWTKALARMAYSVVGTPVERKEGPDKLTGFAEYVDDIRIAGALFGATVRSPAPRGRIVNIEFGPGIPWDEITIVRAVDIPGENCVSLILDDQPCLADGFVNHPEEPVLLLAHEDRYLVEEARNAVRIEIEPFPAIFTLEDSLAKRQIVWGDDNVLKRFL